MKEKPKKSVRMWVANEPTRVIIRLAQYDYKKKHFRKYTCHYQ